MSTRKNKSKNVNTVKKGSMKKNDMTQARKDAVANPAKAKGGKKQKSAPSKPVMLNAEFSTIVMEPEVDLQEDIEEGSFNPPLHSTAVYGDEDDESPEKTKQTSPGSPASLQKSIRGNNSPLKEKTIASDKPNLTRPNVSLKGKKKQKTSQKLIGEESSEKSNVSENTVEGETTSSQSSAQEAAAKSSENTTEEQSTSSQSSAQGAAAKSSENKTEEQSTSSQSPAQIAPTKTKKSGKNKPSVKEKSPPTKKKSKKAVTDGKNVRLKMWSPEDVTRTARDINELDVILYESETLVDGFRESADTDSIRNAVDGFFHSFKDQLTETMKDVQLLVNMKRRNSKVQLEIGRKQKHLIEVRDEIIKKQPRLNELQKQCSEAEKRDKCLNDAKAFLERLQQLQEDYGAFKAKNPGIQETYGLSSLPACLLQSQTTLKAEQHFHNVNKQLQSLLDKMTEQR